MTRPAVTRPARGTQIPRSHTIDIDLLRVFDAVMRLGSFTAAARSLSRTQSAVSMQMKRLEELLGERLIERGTRRLSATPHGLQVLPLARQMLGLNDQLFGDAEPGSVSGHVRVGAIEHYASRLLPPLVAEFCRMHPRIHVEMCSGVSAQMRSELGSRYDIVIGLDQAGSQEGLRLLRSRVVWATSSKLPVHQMRPLPLAVNPEGALFRKWATAALDRAGITWRVAFTSSSVIGLEAAVRSGIAVGVFREDTISKRLKIVGARDGMPPLPEVEVWVATAPYPVKPAVELLESFLIHRLRH